MRPRRRLPSLLALALGLALVGRHADEVVMSLLGAPSASLRPPAKVLLITVDCLRSEYVEERQYAALAPAIHSMKQQGVYFRNAYSQADVTRAATEALLSSRFERDARNSAREELLQERLKARGFRTAAFVSSFVTAGRSFGKGCGPGFEVYDLPPYDGPALEWRMGEATTSRTAAWLTEHRTERWFAWVMLWDLHPRGPVLEITDFPNWYRKQLAYEDDCCARLLRTLTETGQAGETLVVLTANHGYRFPPHAPRGLSEAMLHVPMILWGPTWLRGGRTVEEPVMHVDVVPTVLTLLGLPTRHCSGIDMLAPLDAHRPLYAEVMGGEARSIRVDGWRLIDYLQDFEVRTSSGPPVLLKRGQTGELFDLSPGADPDANVASSHPERVEALRQRLESWAAQGEKTSSPAPFHADDEALRRALRKHGYW